MVAEPSDPSLGVPPTLGTWSPGSGPSSFFNDVTQNCTARANENQSYLHVYHAVSLVTLLVGLCGLAGDGAVIWPLGFRVKRTPFSVYVPHLACADAAFLLCACAWNTLLPLNHRMKEPVLLELVWDTSYLAGLSLLVAVSAERWVSVLWPLWPRCRRPARLSPVNSWVYEGLAAVTFLGLCASGLTLLVRVQCGPWRRRPSRLYVTLLLSALAFLLLGLPYTVCSFVFQTSSFPLYLPLVRPSLHVLVVLDSAVNPIIYFLSGGTGSGRAGPASETCSSGAEG
ncbi:mas-related G-protein coupled receptor member A-like [Talpa occidentalis]|uniref:mas-related G-protein coupled receptor member A-like n=1 Tax=Talpa occidentalis TaxID=50954 RepID=UPI001890B14E|nr:mas-related G-protein coupled receptor member A-like [Talpa occidentalis]